MATRWTRLVVLLPAALALSFVDFISGSQTQPSVGAYIPIIPRTWDEEALASLEVPLAVPSHRIDGGSAGSAVPVVRHRSSLEGRLAPQHQHADHRGSQR
jgi:hypothetical protein